MLKSQYVVIAISLVLVVGLFLLPKVVVDNDNDVVVSADGQSESESAEVLVEGNDHSSELTNEEQTVINDLREQVAAFDGSSVQVSLIDSLVGLYQRHNRYDSAALVLAELADKIAEEPFFKMAGNAFYEAFTFAVNEQRIKYLGEKARFYLEKSLELDPEQPNERVKVAMTYVATSNPMQGILMIRDVLEQHPQNELALFNLGVLSMQTGQYDKALSRFEALKELDPENTQVWFYLGLCYKETNQKQQAIASFEKVKSLESDQEVIRTVDGYLQELQP